MLVHRKINRPALSSSLVEFLTAEFETAAAEHDRQISLLALAERRFEDGKLTFSGSEFVLQEAQCKQQRLITANAKLARDSARASLDKELGRLANEKSKEDAAAEMKAIESELKDNGDELASNNLRELQLRQRDVQLHFRQSWLLQRRADLEKRIAPTPASTQPIWYDDKVKTPAQKLADILS